MTHLGTMVLALLFALVILAVLAAKVFALLAALPLWFWMASAFVMLEVVVRIRKLARS